MTRDAPIVKNPLRLNCDSRNVTRIERMNIRLRKFGATTVYNSFLRAVRPTNNRWLEEHWRRWWNSACRHFAGPVQTVIHGRRVTVNFGYTYPVNMRKYPTLN